jgi:hypothetical protein
MRVVLEVLIERIAALPREGQQECVCAILEIESRHLGAYQLDDHERADILQALDEIKLGEVASDDEAAALFRRITR